MSKSIKVFVLHRNDINSNLADLKNRAVFPGKYNITLESASVAISLSDLLTLVGASHSIDKVWAVIPVGGRKIGSNTLYHAIFDGTYLRCNAEVGVSLTVYIFFALEVI